MIWAVLMLGHLCATGRGILHQPNLQSDFNQSRKTLSAPSRILPTGHRMSTYLGRETRIMLDRLSNRWRPIMAAIILNGIL